MVSDAPTRPRIGILALQGAVHEHERAVRDAGGDPVPIRLPRDLAGVEALIIPGGESTTMRRLIDDHGLREPILALARAGAPIFGTCAGMILLASRIADGGPPVFGLLDIDVSRNAYGRQLHSFEADLDFPTLGPDPIHGVFIRAPVVTRVGGEAEVLARDPDGRPIAVRQGRLLATAFHPELTDDRRLHRLFVELVRDARSQRSGGEAVAGGEATPA